jgi:hypothetical protein
MSIVSGYLVQAFGWRGMFIIEGTPPIIWAFVWRAMVEDWPHRTAWLDPMSASNSNACSKMNSASSSQ